MSTPKVKVLFYHSYFFTNSETFIYQQAINPHIETTLLAKGFLNQADKNNHPFIKIPFKRSWWDGLVSNLLQLFSIDRYYLPKSVNKIAAQVGSHRIEILHAQFGFSAVRLLPIAKKLNLPMIVSFHGLDASRLLRSRSYINGLRQVFRYASVITVCNPGMADVLPLTPEQKKKVLWVPYGINLTQLSPQPRKQNQVLRILHVGRLVEKKGVPDLISAFASVTAMNCQIQLDLVGTGPEEKKCRKAVRENNLIDKVVFHGWKTHEEVKQLMQQCDVFVLNSRVARNGDSEGLPLGILEAMAMALPVVSTYHAAIPIAIDQGITGFLVKECDTNALTDAISKIIKDDQLRNHMGAAARAKVESLFTMEQMHDRLLSAYQNCSVRKPTRVL
jgi:colanic acid/amylovoran biosynthesis glycosyltransferase